jgi:hypothetical protein
MSAIVFMDRLSRGTTRARTENLFIFYFIIYFIVRLGLDRVKSGITTISTNYLLASGNKDERTQ